MKADGKSMRKALPEEPNLPLSTSSTAEHTLSFELSSFFSALEPFCSCFAVMQGDNHAVVAQPKSPPSFPLESRDDMWNFDRNDGFHVKNTRRDLSESYLLKSSFTNLNDVSHTNDRSMEQSNTSPSPTELKSSPSLPMNSTSLKNGCNLNDDGTCLQRGDNTSYGDLHKEDDVSGLDSFHYDSKKTSEADAVREKGGIKNGDENRLQLDMDEVPSGLHDDLKEDDDVSGFDVFHFDLKNRSSDSSKSSYRIF